MSSSTAQKLASNEPSGSNTMPTSRHRRAFVPVHPTPCGKYMLIAKIGHGGMAEVFLAVASGLGGFRKVAVVKRIHPQLLEEPEFVQMFMDEARLAARLSHPNVVQTQEVGEHDGVPFISMEYMEGQPYDKMLKAIRRKGEQLPVKLAVRIAMESLAGLHYAHELRDYDGTSLGVVHRDISPSNIFITYQGVVKILDFGIAKATTKLSETRTGQIKGKLSYMAPEQARGKKIDRRADLWSIGVTLFETCTASRLFKGESDVDTLQRVLTGDISSLLTSEGPDLPPPLLAVIEKSLSRKVQDRYESAKEMRQALADILPELPGPDPDVATYLMEHFEDVAESQRAMLGDLLEHADKLETLSTQEVDLLLDEQAARPQAEAAPPQREHGPSYRTLLMLLLVVLGISGGVFVALETTRGSRDGDGDGDDATARAEPAQTTMPEGSAAETATAPAGPVAEAGGSATEAPAQPEPPPEDSQATDDVEEEDDTEEVTETAEERRRRRWQQRAAERARQARNRRGAQETETPTAPRRAAEPAGAGMLRLVTRPWSEVYLGGRRIGQTPLLNHQLPAGTHTLILRNPEQGLEQRVSVRIQPDETTTLNIALQ